MDSITERPGFRPVPTYSGVFAPRLPGRRAAATGRLPWHAFLISFVWTPSVFNQARLRCIDICCSVDRDLCRLGVDHGVPSHAAPGLAITRTVVGRRSARPDDHHGSRNRAEAAHGGHARHGGARLRRLVAVPDATSGGGLVADEHEPAGIVGRLRDHAAPGSYIYASNCCRPAWVDLKIRCLFSAYMDTASGAPPRNLLRPVPPETLMFIARYRNGCAPSTPGMSGRDSGCAPR